MSTIKLIRGVLVLAGLFDPCGDIGTQCRYDLLPIPWDKDEFRKRIFHMILVEKTDQDSSGVGLKAWMTGDQQCQVLKDLLIHGWSEDRSHLAGIEIDALSFHSPSIDYSWSSDVVSDERKIQAFEELLLSQLEGFE